MKQTLRYDLELLNKEGFNMIWSDDHDLQNILFPVNNEWELRVGESDSPSLWMHMQNNNWTKGTFANDEKFNYDKLSDFFDDYKKDCRPMNLFVNFEKGWIAIGNDWIGKVLLYTFKTLNNYEPIQQWLWCADCGDY